MINCELCLCKRLVADQFWQFGNCSSDKLAEHLQYLMYCTVLTVPDVLCSDRTPTLPDVLYCKKTKHPWHWRHLIHPVCSNRKPTAVPDRWGVHTGQYLICTVCSNRTSVAVHNINCSNRTPTVPDVLYCSNRTPMTLRAPDAPCFVLTEHPQQYLINRVYILATHDTDSTWCTLYLF